MPKYLQVPTRTGKEGAGDKAAMIANQAAWTAKTNRDFLNKVRSIVKGYNSAELQANAWFKYCCSCDYTREFADVFAHPSDTFDHGGDCDDLTILLLAGFMCIGIPAIPDIVMRNGEGQHVRIRAGFPPHDPPQDLTLWNVYDPAKDSELRWVSPPGKDLSKEQHGLYSPKTHSEQYGSYNNVYTEGHNNQSHVVDVRNNLQGRFSRQVFAHGNLKGNENLRGEAAPETYHFQESEKDYIAKQEIKAVKTLGMFGLTILGLVAFGGMYVRAKETVHARMAR